MPFETFLGRLKVKVTLEGHINELFWAITPIYMYGFQNNFTQGQIRILCQFIEKYPPLKNGFFVQKNHLTPPPPPPLTRPDHTHLPPHPAYFFSHLDYMAT